MIRQNVQHDQNMKDIAFSHGNEVLNSDDLQREMNELRIGNKSSKSVWKAVAEMAEQ